jgi:hypothetical protein
MQSGQNWPEKWPHCLAGPRFVAPLPAPALQPEPAFEAVLEMVIETALRVVLEPVIEALFEGEYGNATLLRNEQSENCRFSKP